MIVVIVEKFEVERKVMGPSKKGVTSIKFCNEEEITFGFESNDNLSVNVLYGKMCIFNFAVTLRDVINQVGG